MRIAAQAQATERLDRQEAELQLLLEQEEAEMMEEFEVNLVRDRKLSEGGEENEEVDEEEEDDHLDTPMYNPSFDPLLTDTADEFPSMDDVTRRRSFSAGSPRNNGSDRPAARRGSYGMPSSTSGGGGSVAQRNASIANFGNTSVASIAKSEMDALIAASSLATVSVCLFRWQNIKLFSAFETWMDRVVDAGESDSKKKKSTAFARASQSFHKRHSLSDIFEVTEENEEDQQDDDLFSGPLKQTDTPGASTHASVEMGLGQSVLDTGAPVTKPSSSSGNLKLFSVPGTDNEDSDAEGCATPTSRRSDRSETDSPPALDGGCYECNERVPVLFCHQCAEEYCKVCSQFVHDYCKHMKTHDVVDLSKKPLGVTQMRPSFASTESLDTAVPVSKTVTMRPVPQPPPVTGANTQSSTTPERRASVFKTMGMTSGKGEEGASQKNHCAIRSCDKPATKGVSIRFCDEHYDEFRNGMKISKQHDSEDGETDAKTLQQTIALLTKQLKESGQQPVEFVELCVARERMQAAVERLMGGEEAAENDIERWDKAIKMNPDYQIEMEEKSKKWEADQKPLNHACYLQMRKLIPPDLSAASLGSMIEDGLPKTIANRIWTKKILGMICTHEGDIKRIHIVDLQTKYSNQGLDIVEMRAIWYVMPGEFDLDGDGKKAKWRDLYRQKLEELTNKEEGNRLSNPEKRNNAYKGHDALAIYDPSTEIKKKVIAKSTAFDATEKPDVNNKLGSGIKELRKQMGPEKPLVEGPLLYLSGGSDNPDEGTKAYAHLFKQKKTIMLYPNADKAKDDKDCTEEIAIDKGHTLKLGPGSKTFCLMEGDKECKAFQSDKARREAWTTGLTDIIKLLNTVKKVKKKKKVVEEETPSEGGGDAPPPRPSFLDAIGKKGGGGGDRPPAPSFIDRKSVV